ncbi:MAG TPA: hypothetical protein DCY25_06345 [Bacteroidales bacterium]|nr:hypothetical protein [Bacteroidales bacterium]
MNQQASLKKKNQKEPEKKPVSDGLHNFAKYSGMAFQMMAIILVTTWGGVKLDKVLNLETPVFTVVLSLLGVFAAIYTSLRDFIKK